MEDILIILTAVAALTGIALILVYNYYDRQRFLLERMLRRRMPELDRWARLCGELEPGSDAEYSAAKKLPERMACLRRMAETVKANSPEKLDLQESLLDFCYTYSQAASRLERALALPVLGRFARLCGIRPYAGLDFYPEVKMK